MRADAGVDAGRARSAADAAVSERPRVGQVGPGAAVVADDGLSPSGVVQVAPVLDPPSSDAGAPLLQCVLEPRAAHVAEELFDIQAKTATPDEAALVPGGDWAWSEGADYWPYPARNVAPESVALPLAEDDGHRLVALWADAGTVVVVGALGESPLALRGAFDGSGFTWANESEAIGAATGQLPIELNSAYGTSSGRILVASSLGILESTSPGQWVLLPVPDVVLPAMDVWFDDAGAGVVVGGTVASSVDFGASWELQTRELGFVASGLAYGRRFVRVSGFDGRVSIVGRFGHLLTREDGFWRASVVLASDVAVGPEGRFVTTRRPSNGVVFSPPGDDWQVFPVAEDSRGFGRGALDRVWAGGDGQVLAAGALGAVMHRFADGSWELLPAPPATVEAVAGADELAFYALTGDALYRYDLPFSEGSGQRESLFPDERWQGLAPATGANWGDAAPPSFESPACVDAALGSNTGEGVWEGVLAEQAPVARYGSCSSSSDRSNAETVTAFTAPATGTYRFVLEEDSLDSGPQAQLLALALRNSCEGWVVWDSSRRQDGGVDIGLVQGQTLLVEVYAQAELAMPVGFAVSIY